MAVHTGIGPVTFSVTGRYSFHLLSMHLIFGAGPRIQTGTYRVEAYRAIIDTTPAKKKTCYPKRIEVFFKNIINFYPFT